MSTPYTFHIRFAEQKLWERRLRRQVEALRANGSLRQLTISDVGVEMLSAMVGRGMAPTLRRVIAATLQETLNGLIPLEDSIAGHIFTEVYGEVIGPLVTCLTRGGDYQMIRLVGRRGADVLLVEQSSRNVILQECKGSFVDYNRVHENSSRLDICGRLRKKRNEGRQQLKPPNANEISAQGVRVRPIAAGPAGLPHSERSVVVTVVPDGRLNPDTSANPAHKQCRDNCIKSCLFSPKPTLVCVLSSEPADTVQLLDGDTWNFLRSYKASERAIWAEAHGSFWRLFCETLESSGRLKKWRSSATPFLLGLLGRAVERGVFVNPVEISFASRFAREPGLRKRIHRLLEKQWKLPQPSLEEIKPGDLRDRLRTAWPRGKEQKQINWQVRFSEQQVEASIRSETDGTLTMRLVPADVDQEHASDHVRSRIKRVILSALTFDRATIDDGFRPEKALWTGREGAEYTIGDVLESEWLGPLFPWPAPVLAFVTNDARGFIRIPNFWL